MMSLAFSRPAGLRTFSTESEMPTRMCNGFHPISAALRIAIAANFGVVRFTKTSTPVVRDLHQLRVDGWVCHFVGLLDNDIAHLVAEAPLESCDVVTTETIGGVENTNPGIR